MARTPKAPAGVKIIRTEERIPTDPNAEEFADDQETDESGEPVYVPTPLESLLDDLGGDTGSQLTVWRVDPQSPNGRRFCGSMPPGISDSLTVLETLQTKYGGGNFILQVREKGGTFSNRVQLSVDAPIAPPIPPAVQVQESVATAINAAMAPMQQILGQLVAMQANRGPAFNVDKIVDSAIKLAPVIGILQQFIRPNVVPAQAGGFDLAKFLEMKAQLDALGMGDRDPPAGAQVVQFLEKFGGPIMKAFEQANANGGRPPQAQPNPRPMHAPSPVNPAGPMFAPPMPTAPAPVSIAGIDLTSFTLPYVQNILLMARANMDPDTAANAIIEALPESETVIDAICEAIELGQLTPALVKHPELTGYRVWIDRVGAAILDALDGGDDADVPSDNTDAGADTNVPERGTAT